MHIVALFFMSYLCASEMFEDGKHAYNNNPKTGRTQLALNSRSIKLLGLSIILWFLSSALLLHSVCDNSTLVMVGTAFLVFIYFCFLPFSVIEVDAHLKKSIIRTRFNMSHPKQLSDRMAIYNTIMMLIAMLIALVYKIPIILKNLSVNK